MSVVPRNGSGPGWSDDLAEEIERRLRALGVEPPRIRVTPVEELARTDSLGAKLALVRSEL